MTTQTTTPLTPEDQRNFRHLYYDVFWWGILAGSALAFLGVFLARLGANSFQIGILASGPALVNLAVSLPAGRWMQGKPLVPFTFWTSVWHRLSFLALAGLPWLFASQPQLVWAALAVVLVFAIPGTLVSISFNAMFADLVPPEWRPMVVGKRNALLNVAIVAASIASGFLLDRLPFPYNYQLVFGVGAFAAGMSSYHLSRLHFVHTQHRVGRPLRDQARVGWMVLGDTLRGPAGLRYLIRRSGKALLRPDLLRGPYGLFLLAYLLFYIAQHLPLPLFPIYFVQYLDLADSQLSVATASYHTMMFLSSLALGWIVGRFGDKRTFQISVILYAAFPLFVGLWPGWEGVLAAHLVGGLIWGVANGGMVNALMERSPADDRPAHMALHNVALHLGVLGGTLLGAALGDWIGVQEAIVVGGAARILAGIALALLL